LKLTKNVLMSNKRKKSSHREIILLYVLRTVGSLKAALLFYRQRHLLVLRCATLPIYTVTPCVCLACMRSLIINRV